MKTAIFSPKSMQNSIWSRPEFKHTKNNWQFDGRRNPQKAKNIVHIQYAKPSKEGYHFMGAVLKGWDEVKAHAAANGINEVRMGAIKAKITA